MNELAVAIEEVRTELADIGSEILFDVCDIDGPSFIDGGASGDSVDLSPAASGVNITYKGLGGTKQFVVGGETYTASHQLKMVRTIETLAITPRHRITVRARGLTSALVFQNPLIVEDSISPLLKINATLVVQGYQQR